GIRPDATRVVEKAIDAGSDEAADGELRARGAGVHGRGKAGAGRESHSPGSALVQEIVTSIAVEVVLARASIAHRGHARGGARHARLAALIGHRGGLGAVRGRGGAPGG